MGVPRTGVGLSAGLLFSLILAATPAIEGVARAGVRARRVPAVRRHLHQRRWARAEPGDLPDGSGYPLGRAGRAAAGGRLDRSVVPGDPSQPRVPLRGQRVGRDPGASRTGASAPSRSTQSKGTLTLLNQQSSAGSGPCHLVVDRQGQNVLVANYGSGSVGCLPIERDGRLRPGDVDDPAPGPGRRPPATGRAARALDQPRRGQPLRVRRRPRARQGPRLRLRPGGRHAHPAPAAVRRGRAGLRPAALRLPPRRPVRLRHQRDGQHRDRLRLRRRPRHPLRDPDDLDPARRRHAAGAPRPRSRSTLPASSSTARTAGTTASRSSPSTRRRAS